MKIAMLGLRALGDCSGGVETHVQELATRMARAGHEVTVFCRTRYNTITTPIHHGVRLENRPCIATKHLEAITHTALVLPSVLAGYDVVHFHATGPSLLCWVPRLAGRRVIVTVHGLDFERAKWGGLATRVLKAGAWTAAHCPHRTIVVSHKLRQYYRQRHGKDTVHIPNGVNQPRRRPLEALARFGLAPEGYILSLGRLVPEKGVHTLIEAFRPLQTPLKLLIAGASSHSDGYRDRLLDLAGGDPRIIFAGPLHGQDKDEAFSNARLFVLPSELEGMPIVLLEAMSYGCPVLTSSIEECLEVFRLDDAGRQGAQPPDWHLGAAFRTADPVALGAVLAQALHHDGLGDMGRRGRGYVLRHYDWDAITQATLNVYRQACAPRA